MKKSQLIVSVILATIALGCVLWVFVWLNHPIRLIVENESSNALEQVRVNVGKYEHEFGDLEPNTRKEKWFFYRGSDSSFTISAKNQTFEGRWGYVTNGPVGFETVYIQINQDGSINFDQK